MLLVGLACFAQGACVHQTLIRTEPEGAQLYVDGKAAGESPIVVERALGTFGEMRVQAELDAFETTTVIVQRSEWFLWPLLLAATPLLLTPTVVVPVIGPFICGGWAVVTSPSLLTLAFLRRYPTEVTVPLRPRLRLSDGFVMPTDDWTTPEDYSPNPLPPVLGPASEDELPLPPQSDDPKHAEDKAPNPPPSTLRY